MKLPLAPATYPIDTVHSQIGFKVSHLGLTVVRGTFDEFRGALEVGRTLDEVSVRIEAEMASVSSSHPGRDEHIQNEDFFHSAVHPTMTFDSTSVSESGDGYELAGDLTIKGVTLPVALPVSYNGSAEFPMDGSIHHGFSVRGAINRSDFNMGFGVPLVSDEVGLEMEVQFIQPDL